MSVAASFHSLGDNCEFGFVQRATKQEPRDLLRWAVSPPDILIDNIESDFEGIYTFEKLVPFTNKMVLDTGTGLKFHSKMLSIKGEFVLADEDRRAIYKDEFERVCLKRAQLLAEMKEPTRHFIYKHNHGISEEQCQRIARAISLKGPGAILIVHAGISGKATGDVEHIQNNLYYGYVNQFAKYERADGIDLDCWMAVLDRALTLMPDLKKSPHNSSIDMMCALPPGC